MKKIDRIKFIIVVIIYLSIISTGLIALVDNNWMYVGISILTLIIMLLPSTIEKRYRMEIYSEFEIILILFIYSGIYLGELQLFYYKFWWWDKMLHSFSGLIFGNIGFIIANYTNINKNANLKLRPIFIAFFCFCFAVSMGAIWEIYEYTMDKTFGFFMQRGSLDDTMIDIILDTIGALVFAIIVYLKQKRKLRHIRINSN